ncbi:hypothetical protein [Lysobacter gummosus]|uniref:hypothetical protein n=1 Tax=Lysobacter gummosus TaxID=262324 RepID=UPI00363DFCEE
MQTNARRARSSCTAASSAPEPFENTIRLACSPLADFLLVADEIASGPHWPPTGARPDRTHTRSKRIVMPAVPRWFANDLLPRRRSGRCRVRLRRRRYCISVETAHLSRS